MSELNAVRAGMVDSYILFEVAGTTYAVRAAQVQQVEMIGSITRVPNAPNYVEGLVTLRGQVVPVINLRRRFGFELAPYDLRSRLIVVQQEDRTVGMAVDVAREFTTIDPGQIRPPPEAALGRNTDYLEGVVAANGRLILILDVHRILSMEEAAAAAPLESAGG